MLNVEVPLRILRRLLFNQVVERGIQQTPVRGIAASAKRSGEQRDGRGQSSRNGDNDARQNVGWEGLVGRVETVVKKVLVHIRRLEVLQIEFPSACASTGDRKPAADDRLG